MSGHLKQRISLAQSGSTSMMFKLGEVEITVIVVRSP
jgi:hypothetical protein